MSTYAAPLKDMQFVLTELAGLDQVASLPGCEEATADVVEAILAESAKFTEGVLAPLNWTGDREGVRWADKAVTMPKGFKEAYAQFVDNGWNALGGNPEHGGQGLPKLVSAAVQEMWKSSNMAFSLCPLLTLGAVEALEIAGNEQQQAMYLPNMISGKWTGTMNITEPQAGSDLAACRRPTAATASSATRSSSPTATTTWRRTPSTSCWPARRMRRKASRASRCSWCRSSSSMPTVRSERATTPTASRSSTSSASTPARPASWRWATAAVRSAPWSARRTKASSTCS
jgi:hypothetical protein